MSVGSVGFLCLCVTSLGAAGDLLCVWANGETFAQIYLLRSGEDVGDVALEDLFIF